MKRSAVIAVLAAGVLACLAFAQSYKGQGKLQGTVTDEEGRPLAGVTVKLFSEKAKAGFELNTDAEGKWRALYIRGGGWNLDFLKPGYMPHKLNTNIQESGQNKPIDVRLKKMEGLIVTDELKAGLDRGNRLFDEKRYDEAIAVYEDLVKANPEAYILSQNIGNCYFQKEEYDKAEAFYARVLEKDPKNAEAMLRIGNCHANRGETEKAMEWYAKIEFDKITDPNVLFNIGTAFYRRSRFEEALKYYKRSVELKSDFLDGIYQMGLTYISLQNNAEAVKVFEQYFKLDPDSPKAAQVRNFLEYLRKK